MPLSKSHKKHVREDLDDDLLDEEDSHITSKDNWIRGLYILLFFAISYIVAFVMFFIVLFQFISDAFFKKTNEHICDFTQSVSLYMAQVIRYLGYNSDELPFPFSPWPKSSSEKD